MGWSIGYDLRWNRDIGYGVPATCDQPGCGARIDRGLAHVCGGAPYGGGAGCGLYFCEADLSHDLYGVQLCDRCERGILTPHTPTPDVEEWIKHKATDPSWAAWRAAQEPTGGTDHG